MTKGKHFWTLLYGALLFCFTLYVVLDTFVLTRRIDDVTQGGSHFPNSDMSDKFPELSTPIITENPLLQYYVIVGISLVVASLALWLFPSGQKQENRHSW